MTGELIQLWNGHKLSVFLRLCVCVCVWKREREREREEGRSDLNVNKSDEIGYSSRKLFGNRR